jgi:hypothetical protein
MVDYKIMNDKRITRLNEILNELHDIANSFAGDETGVVAVELHYSSNRIANALRMLEDGITPEDKHKQLVEWLSDKPELMNILYRKYD